MDLGTSLHPWNPDEPAWTGAPPTCLVVLHWALVGGRAECVGVELRSFRRANEDQVLGDLYPEQTDAKLPITTSQLRALPLGRLIDETRRSRAGSLRAEWATDDQRARAYDGLNDAADRLRAGETRVEWSLDANLQDVEAPTDEARALLAAYDHEKRGGRPRIYGAEHWAEVARVYTEAWQRGDPPTKAVAEHFTVAKSTAAKWVARCRRLGVLPETSKGRPNARRDQP